MQEPTVSLPAEVAATIQGDISGQVVVGNNNYQLQIGSMYGAVINTPSPATRPPTARPTPVRLLPKPFDGLLDRTDELRTIADAITERAPVEIHGEAGLGKTVLLRHLAHRRQAQGLPDGVVHVSADNGPVADVLHAVYEAFYETQAPYKPTPTQLRIALQSKRALLLIDDPELGEHGIAGLLDAAPASAVVVTGETRRLWGEGRSIALPGLPVEEAVRLVEGELGRRLTSTELPALRRLCANLGGHPLRLLRAAAQVREEGRTFDDLAQADRSAHDAGQVQAASTLAAMSDREREIAVLLAAIPGPLDEDDIAGIAGLEPADTRAVLQDLLRRRIVHAHPPGYSLAGDLGGLLEQEVELSRWRVRALWYFEERATELARSPKEFVARLPTTLALLRWAAASERWDDLLRLGQTIDSALAVSLRWAAWEQALWLVRDAAVRLGNPDAEAWALHQLGTRALCLGDVGAARTLLSRALQLRESIGNRIGAAITRHNLGFLAGPPGRERGERPDRKPPGLRPWQRPAIRLLAAALVPLVAAVVWRASVAAHPSSPPTTTSQAESPPTGTTSSSSTFSIPTPTTTPIPTTTPTPAPDVTPTPAPDITPTPPTITRFVLNRQDLNVTVYDVDATVTPPGERCKRGNDHATTCIFVYNEGESVTLTATNTAPYRGYVKWEGACSADPCTVIMDSGKAVTATFITFVY